MAKTGPEHELVRLPTLKALLSKGWNRDQIICPSSDSEDAEWRVPQSPHDASKRERGLSFKSWPVDLVIFDSPEHVGEWDHVLGIFEFKAPNIEAGRSQLEVYMNREPRCKFGYWTNGVDSVAVFRLADGEYEIDEHARLPRPADNLRRASKKPLTYDDLSIPDEFELATLFGRLLDTIAASDSIATRPEQRLNEVANLLIVKLESDKIGYAHRAEELMFQIRATAKETTRAINDLYKSYKLNRPELFLPDDADAIRFDNETLHWAVLEMQSINFKESSPSAFSKAFQVFRTANLKVGDGQYFTPYRVIEAGIKMLDITDKDKVIDPACGAGGFLYNAYESVSSIFEGDMGKQPEARTWAHDKLFGVDRDSINVKLTRALMVAIGDGSAHIFVGDSIRSNKWEKEYPLLQIEAMKEGSYTVVVTNPPFGKNLRMSERDARLGKYSICKHKPGGEPSNDYSSTEIGIAFVEQAYRLLQPGGRLGIVLPETYFFSKSYTWFRKWIEERFVLRGVLNIPMEAFQEFCRAKTNFYVLQKKGEPSITTSVPKWFRDDMVWVSYAPTIGINKDGFDLFEVDQDGHRLKAIDNKAIKDVEALLGQADTKTSCYMRLEAGSFLGVPKYSDRSQERLFLKFTTNRLPDFSVMSLGNLIDSGYINVCIGHGSPSADVRNGDIPYIKVSDLRAGLVNVNSTNMVPKRIAEKMWRGKSSGLEDYCVITPARASSNIGEISILLPDQTQIVLTKEVLVFRASDSAPFDNFYIAWALDLPQVREEWRRVIFMQTNRDDVGDRYREVLVPVPPSAKRAREVSSAYRDYYTGLSDLKERLIVAKRQYR